ncbi:hypothetical protein ABPG75_007015 [Micractinium tetrahymenae]
MQLGAAHDIFTKALSRLTPRLAALLAAEAAPPESLLPWLAAVSGALVLASGGPPEERACMHCWCRGCFCVIGSMWHCCHAGAALRKPCCPRCCRHAQLGPLHVSLVGLLGPGPPRASLHGLPHSTRLLPPPCCRPGLDLREQLLSGLAYHLCEGGAGGPPSPFAAHQAQLLGGGAATAAAVVDALLLCALPGIADALEESSAAYDGGSDAGGSGDRSGSGTPGEEDAATSYGKACAALSMLSQALGTKCLQSALAQRRQPAGTLAACLRHSRRVVAALPLAPIPRVSPALVPIQLSSGMRLVDMLAEAAYHSVVVPDSEAGDACSNGRSGGRTQRAAGGGASRQQRQLQEEAEEVAWEVVHLVPPIAMALAALLEGFEGDRDGAASARSICDLLPNAIMLIHPLRGSASLTAAQLAALAAAAEAGLRLLPLLPRQAAMSCSLCRSFVATLWRLSTVLLARWASEAAEGELSRPLAANEAEQAAQRLWQLHTRAARLVHCLAQQLGGAVAAAPGPAACLWDAELWRELLAGANLALNAAQDALVAAHGEEASARRRLGIVSAHLEALDAALAAAQARWGSAGEAAVVIEVLMAFTSQALDGCPPLSDPAWMARLRRGAACLAESPRLEDAPSSALSLLACVLAQAGGGEEGPGCARLAAGLAASGALQDILGLCQRLPAASSDPDDATEWAKACMVHIVTISGVLDAHARKLGAAYVAEPDPPADLSGAEEEAAHARENVMARMAAAMSGMQRADAAMMGGLDACHGDASAAARAIGGMLPALAELGAALQAHWALPEQAQAAALERHGAAATRSCAYLRCANLGGVGALHRGGPAAGQGVGSKRCSACGVSYYCGTACSHADWRAGGHKRACKLLAAQRQQQAEQQG